MRDLLERVSVRSAILADATVSGAAGLLMLVAASPLGDLLDLPVMLLRIAGLIIVPYVGFLVYVATRSPIATASVWAVIGANLLWTAGSIIVLLSGEVGPNALGVAFVLVQAGVVSLFAELQFLALQGRRSRGMSAA
ncbi:MAG: hypothetical protein WBA63_03455 [Thermomicrobiales bacterium]